MQFIGQIEVSTDEAIIQKILSGETTLFEILIRRYNQPLYKIARGFGLNHHDAQDLMQETHLQAYLKLNSFRGEASYKTWLSKIMVRYCLQHIERSSYKNERPARENIGEEMHPMFSRSDDGLDKAMNNRELIKLVESSLENLSPVYKTVFVLRELEGFSVAETASLLDITTVNVKVRLNRAKAMLHKELEKLYTTSELFEFNLVYCTEVVNNVFERINQLNHI